MVYAFQLSTLGVSWNPDLGQSLLKCLSGLTAGMTQTLEECVVFIEALWYRFEKRFCYKLQLEVPALIDGGGVEVLHLFRERGCLKVFFALAVAIQLANKLETLDTQLDKL